MAVFSQIAGVLVLVGLCINVGYVYIRNRCLGSPSMCIPSSMAATTGSGIPDPNTFLGTKRHVISSKRLRNQKINPIFVMSNFSNSNPPAKNHIPGLPNAPPTPRRGLADLSAVPFSQRTSRWLSSLASCGWGGLLKMLDVHWNFCWKIWVGDFGFSRWHVLVSFVLLGNTRFKLFFTK